MDEKETVEELRAALAELDSGEGLGRFVEGHGLQSRFFAISWESERLEIAFRLPYARVLSDENDQSLDAARVGAAIRMAILLLTVAAEGKLLSEGETRISVEADEDGALFHLRPGRRDGRRRRRLGSARRAARRRSSGRRRRPGHLAVAALRPPRRGRSGHRRPVETKKHGKGDIP